MMHQSEIAGAAERTPRPKSPPEYAGLYGKRRHLTSLTLLEKEITSLQEELKSLDVIQPSSRCCQEVNEFVVSRPDPLIATDQNHHKSKCCSTRWGGLVSDPRAIPAAAVSVVTAARAQEFAQTKSRHSLNRAETLIRDAGVAAAVNWIHSAAEMGTGNVAAYRLFRAPSQDAVTLLVVAASSCARLGGLNAVAHASNSPDAIAHAVAKNSSF